MTSDRSPGLLDALFTTRRMREIFSDRARLQGMLDFEAALARAEASVGVIPAAAAEPIASRCRADLFDVEELARATARAGNAAIPLVRALTELVARDEPDAARYVHWGATSQDAIDTGLVLQIRLALDELESDLERLSTTLAHLAEAHRGTVVAGRTWLQQAEPVTFGLKAAGWLAASDRHRSRLGDLRGRVLSLQLGGAAGTLAALGPQAMAVGAALARALGLALPEAPWHSERDRMAETATALGLLVGSLGKMARDVSLLMQTEVAEAFEPREPGRGGSTAMPQKRNPVGSAVALAAAVRVPGLVSAMLSAMVQEHERGLGGWHAEWETLPEIFLLAGGALHQMLDVLAGLEVDADRMRSNLEAVGGGVFAGAVAMALAPHLGTQRARELLERAWQRAVGEGKHLREVLAEDATVRAHLSPDDLGRAFQAGDATRAAEQIVERILAAHRGGRREPH